MFYGWYIVIAGTVLNACFGGLIFYGFTALVNPIADTFGWSYAQISLAMTLRGLETGFLNPFLGVVADRWPPKRLVLIGVVIVGLGLLCLSQVSNLAMFYVSFMIVALGSSLGISMVPTTTIARWFKRDIGKAISIFLGGAGIGGFFIPLLVKMIDAYGWQTSVLILGIGVWIVCSPIAFIFRSRPEDYGLLPDGRTQDDLKDTDGSEAYDFSTGVKEALKMPAFWYIGIAWMLHIAAVHAVVVHVMPYLTSVGMERSRAGMVAMMLPVVSIAGRLPFGWLADIFNKKYVIVSSIVLTAVGLILFSIIDGTSFGLIVLFIIVFGLSLSGFFSLRPPILREYFGTKNFGTIYGFTHIFVTVGGIVSPPVAGWVFDTRGVYDPIWLILSAVCVIAVILVLATPPPSRNSKSGNRIETGQRLV